MATLVVAAEASIANRIVPEETLDIVDQLNLDGDTNGEHVAAEHVTNDYATDAADAKAAYHGATINESNSEGRAGEGHAEEHAH